MEAARIDGLSEWAIFFKMYMPIQKSTYAAAAVITFILGAAGIAAFYYIGGDSLENLLPNIMKNLSLYERFNVFVNGVFDLTGIVYYISVIAFFLFLSIQSLEKRRYN